MNLLIRNGCIVNPSENAKGGGREDYPVQDIFMSAGRIREVGKDLELPADTEVLDAEGKHVFPGFVDLHTHFREPGYESKETIMTGSQAAIRGGYVASVSMPNTLPACDHESVIDNIIRKAKEVPYHIFPAGTISKNREGKELSEMADLKQAGIVAVTDDGSWVADALLMRRAMEYASMLDLIVMSHCEDLRLSANGVMNEGLMSTKLGLRGITDASEVIAVARDIELARLTGGRLHICHVSSARSVELIRRARAEGIPVTTEVTPHNLMLTDESLEGYDTNCKMYPPLRTSADLKALREGLRDGTIDCIATDHAPHTAEEKMAELDVAPFGTTGLETSFAVAATELYHGEKWPLSKLCELLAFNPARILKMDHRFGKIAKGYSANITIADVRQEWTVHEKDFVSKSHNSCFLGKKLKGRITATVCAGKVWKFNGK